MEHTPPLEDRLPEQGSLSLWGRIRQWLGENTIRRMTGEASKAVGETNGGSNGGGTATAVQEPQEFESMEEQIERIMAASEARYEEETKWEAGGKMGVLPQLVIGPQRYPSPKMWGPEDPPDDPLTIDEEYGEVSRRLDEWDRRTGGFDGTP